MWPLKLFTRSTWSIALQTVLPSFGSFGVEIQMGKSKAVRWIVGCNVVKE